jgi:hypothetical protein
MFKSFYINPQKFIAPKRVQWALMSLHTGAICYTFLIAQTSYMQIDANEPVYNTLADVVTGRADAVSDGLFCGGPIKAADVCGPGAPAAKLYPW